jgi:hypothetical protein
MTGEKPIDALRLKAELGDRVSRALIGRTPEEQLRWIREEAAEYRKLNPTPPADETRKTA